jgi:hypothetical protein
MPLAASNFMGLHENANSKGNHTHRHAGRQTDKDIIEKANIDTYAIHMKLMYINKYIYVCNVMSCHVNM